MVDDDTIDPLDVEKQPARIDSFVVDQAQVSHIMLINWRKKRMYTLISSSRRSCGEV